MRAYAVATTAVNITDWASAYSFALSADMLRAVDIPALVVCGEASHPTMRRLCALVSECIADAGLASVDSAAHFMIATHASEVARLLVEHVQRAEAADTVPAKIAEFSRENKDVLKDIGAARRHGERTSTRNMEPFTHNR